MYKVILFSQAYIYINMFVAIIRYPLFDIHIDHKWLSIISRWCRAVVLVNSNARLCTATASHSYNP